MANRLPDDVLNVIQNHLLVNSDKCEVRIDTQLDPLLFERVKEVFTLYGARWKGVLAKGSGRHVFPTDPQPILDLILATGEANPNDFYPTPESVGDYLVRCLALETLPQNAVVLEPNYGTGALVRACIKKLVELGRLDVTFVGVEKNQGLVELARKKRMDNTLTLHHADFNTWDAGPLRFDRVIMNSPFTEPNNKDAYIAHITKAWSLLKPDGLLAGLTPPGWTFRDQDKTAVTMPLFFDGAMPVPQFRNFVAMHGHSRQLAPGLFKSVGTGISVVAVLLGKTRPETMPDPPKGMVKEEPKVDEPEYENPVDILDSLLANEREIIALTANLRRELGQVFGVDTPDDLCPFCRGDTGAQYAFTDNAGRRWHERCALTHLADYQPDPILELELCQNITV